MFAEPIVCVEIIILLLLHSRFCALHTVLITIKLYLLQHYMTVLEKTGFRVTV